MLVFTQEQTRALIYVGNRVDRPTVPTLRGHRTVWSKVTYVCGGGWRKSIQRVEENITIMEVSPYDVGWLGKVVHVLILPLVWWRIWSVIRKSEPDCVYMGIPSGFAFTLWPLFAIADADIVPHVRGRWYQSIAGRYPGRLAKVAAWLGERVFDWLVSRCNLVVVSGHELEEQFSSQLQNCVVHRWTSTTHNSVEMRKEPPDGTELLFVGRLSGEKRVEDLLRAVESLSRKTIVPVRCRIVGDGPERKRLELLVTRLGIVDSVTFEGHINEDQRLWAAYRSADYLVLPSVTEGSPKVILEAMSRGCIPIATKVGGIPRIINDQNNGFLVNTERPEEIVAIVKSLYGSKNKLKRLSDACVQFAEEHTLDKEVARLWEKYEATVREVKRSKECSIRDGR